MLRMAFFRDFMGNDTILVAGESPDLLALAARLRLLEDPASQPLPIHALPFVAGQDDLRLTAYPVGRDLVLRLQDNAGGKLRFNWQYSQEGWLWAAEKIEHLASTDEGHQWMDGEYADDAVVMVSKGEYDDRWWEKADAQQARG